MKLQILILICLRQISENLLLIFCNQIFELSNSISLAGFETTWYRSDSGFLGIDHESKPTYAH